MNPDEYLCLPSDGIFIVVDIDPSGGAEEGHASMYFALCSATTITITTQLYSPLNQNLIPSFPFVRAVFGARAVAIKICIRIDIDINININLYLADYTYLRGSWLLSSPAALILMNGTPEFPSQYLSRTLTVTGICQLFQY